jgi:hypothetical protein
MADPVTTGMAAVGMGTSIFGAITGAQGARASGAAAQQMGMYQVGVAQMNARIARQNAEYADFQGEKEAHNYGMQAAQRMGHIKAAQGASGLDVNSGSAKDVQDSQSMVTSMDLAQLRQNAAKAAYDYRAQASAFDIEAMGAAMGAQNAVSASRINATTSIISGAASVADRWMQGRQVGLWGRN